MKDRPDSACPREEIALFAIGELSPEQQAGLRDHLARCAACREELDGLRTTLAALPRPSLDISPAEARRFAARVRGRIEEKSPSRLPAWGSALAAAGVLALALFVLRPAGLDPAGGENRRMVAEIDLLENLDLLQNLELLEDLDLLQELEEPG